MTYNLLFFKNNKLYVIKNLLFFKNIIRINILEICFIFVFD